MTDRYSRQTLFGGIGPEGQRKLADSRVLIVGCGALGASHAETLARAGVGFIRLADRDFVESSNLQRQTLYSESDAAERLPKAVAAKRRLAEVNSEVEIDARVVDVNCSNIEALISDIDVILDGSDNFEVRYLLNDVAIKHGVPWIYGAAVSSYGTTMTVIPGETPCLRCVFEEMPPVGSAPTCDTAGVIQPIITTISAVQTTEALKLLTGRRDLLHGSLMQFDVWKNDWRKITLSDRDPQCEACANRVFIHLDREAPIDGIHLCGRDAVQILPHSRVSLDLVGLAARIGASCETKVNEYLLRFNCDGLEATVFQDGRAIVRGTDDLAVARSLYSRYIGS